MAKQLQFLRNSTVFTSKDAAVDGLKNKLTTMLAGEPAIAIYNEGTEPDVKFGGVLFGISVGDMTGSYQIFEGAKLSAEGKLEIPEEVKNAIDKAIANIKGVGLTTYDTLKKVENALNVINGEDTVNGSIAKSLVDAKSYTDGKIAQLNATDTAVAKNFVTSVSEENGIITVKRGAITSSGNTVTITDGTDGGINIDVVSSAFTQYVGKDAIAVSTEANEKKEISLVIDKNEKVLSQSTSGLVSTLSLEYVPAVTGESASNAKIVLKGKDNEEISSIDASKFLVDGMLESVKFSENDSEKDTLVFTWNTDGKKTATKINFGKYIDVYTAGNGINIADHSIAVKLDTKENSDNALTVNTNGLYLSSTWDCGEY